MIVINKPIIGKEEIEEVKKVLLSGQLAQGLKVKEFEDQFAKYIGVKHAIATTNGTTALHLAVLSLGLSSGDEVITTPFSFIASSNCLLYCNLKPVFVDINEDDFGINPDLIEEKITKKTKAILVVHLFGQTVDMSKINKIAKKHKLLVIEDACQAHGAMFLDKKSGSLGNIGCFSFYPTKNMTCGEGGMITTNDDNVDEKIRLLRSHGQSKRYYHSELGFNFRMTEICAAIGIEQLKKLDGFNKKRRENANYLNKNLNNVKGLVCPFELKGRKHVFHQYTLRILNDFPITREIFIEKLIKAGIDASIYYPVLIPDQEFYKKLGYSESLPVAKKVCEEVVSVPINPSLVKKELSFIIKTIKNL